MPRYFTLAQAEHVLPHVREAVVELKALKGYLDEARRELRASLERIHLLGGCLVDSAKIAEQRSRSEALAARLKESIASIQEHGCIIKDLDQGLVDFPTLFRDEEVYLCWQLGEDRITYWHGVDEGFRGRKPIDAAFLAEHRSE